MSLETVRRLARAARNTAAPNINVTPLIDVLLVMLIIFMVVMPLKPSRFEAKIPQPPPPDIKRMIPHIDTLVVTINSDLSLKLNSVGGMGTVNDTSRLSAELAKLFRERKGNRVYRSAVAGRPDVSEDERVEKTVFIKAPRAMRYGDVAKVIDGIKGAGAEPIGLQVDDLD